MSHRTGIFFIDDQHEDATLYVDTPAGTIIIDYERINKNAITISAYSLLCSNAPIVNLVIPTAALSAPIEQ